VRTNLLGRTAAADAARARALGLCELGPHQGAEFAHRISRGRLGSYTAANGLWLCNWHHQVLSHGSQALSYDAGWMVHTDQDPATVPVWLDGAYGPGWWLLDDDGGFTPAGPGRASITVPQPADLIPRPRSWKAPGAHR
jgi:hypothetical protein